MDTPPPVTHIGLCAGYGGIELGLHRAVRGMRTVALCEIEAFAISNLVAKMESGLMDPAPIWPDLKTFPWSAFRDRVDILTGGYPCQPFSAAGQRKGKQDPRHLWPFIADGIRLLRPKLCFFENVEGHISLGLSDVIEDLAGMGYRTTWGIFSAAECGAPHQRKRVFILAHKLVTGLPGLLHDTATQGWQDAGRSSAGCSQPTAEAWPSRPGEQQYGWEPPRVVADAGSVTRGKTRRQFQSNIMEEEGWNSKTTKFGTGSADSETMADAKKSGQRERQEDIRGTESDRPSKAMVDTGCQRQEERQLPTSGSEQSDQAVMADTGISGCDGRPDGTSGWSRESGEAGEDASGWRSESHGMRQTQPPLGGDTDGPAGGMDYAELCVTCDNRTDELRLLGNGVVPATAERAFRVLIKELYTAPAGS